MPSYPSISLIGLLPSSCPSHPNAKGMLPTFSNFCTMFSKNCQNKMQPSPLTPTPDFTDTKYLIPKNTYNLLIAKSLHKNTILPILMSLQFKIIIKKTQHIQKKTVLKGSLVMYLIYKKEYLYCFSIKKSKHKMRCHTQIYTQNLYIACICLVCVAISI